MTDNAYLNTCITWFLVATLAALIFAGVLHAPTERTVAIAGGAIEGVLHAPEDAEWSFLSNQETKEGRLWVMQNVYMGMGWDSPFWISAFGMWEELPTDHYNPRIIKSYYFKSIDISLMVNILGCEIETWREGKWDHGP